jgi:hypothetical protein
MSATQNDGGPAFPWWQDGNTYRDKSGMSLRDYFAGQALAGMMRKIDLENEIDLESSEINVIFRVAPRAYYIAELMLEQKQRIESWDKDTKNEH